MKNSLYELVCQQLEFLALAPDSEVNPDSAVRQLEIASSLLKQLPPEMLQEFFEHTKSRLSRLRDEKAPSQQLEFLENLRDNLGV